MRVGALRRHLVTGQTLPLPVADVLDQSPNLAQFMDPVDGCGLEAVDKF